MGSRDSFNGDTKSLGFYTFIFPKQHLQVGLFFYLERWYEEGGIERISEERMEG